MDIDKITEHQMQLMDQINRLMTNYKKDGPSRRTVTYITNKVYAIDGFWQEFQANHEKLEGLEDKDIEYFTGECYQRLSSFYEESRQYLLNHLKTAEWEQKPKTAESKVSTGQKPQSSASMMAEAGEPKQSSSNQVWEEPQHYQNKDQSITRKSMENSNQTKVQEMLRKQHSNFKAFKHTINCADHENIEEKWELEDLLKTIQSRWETIDNLHWKIDSELFEDDEKYEQTYYHYEKQYKNIKREINIKIISTCHREKSTPKMDIPVFNGSFYQWVSFKDLFTETIHKNQSMSKAQKMQYLKNKVRGEAEKLIHHLNISSDNYDTCWEILNHRYNNTKLIFASHVNNLLSIPTMQQQNYIQIKKLHDTMNECLNAIKNLGVNITTWDPLVVHILAQKLDTETHSEYIESLKNPRDLPTLEDFVNFLEMKFTSLESSRRKSETQKSTSQSAVLKKPTFKSFGGTKDTSEKDFTEKSNKSYNYKNRQCPVCKKNHAIFNCDILLKSTVEQQRNIIAKHDLCKNCLYPHKDKDCFSKKRCRTCDGQHNTILCEAFGDMTKSSITSSVQNLMGHFQQDNDFQSLLATALLKVKSYDGTYYEMRALIDLGSQISIISERAAQQLQIPRQQSRGTVYGIGARGNTCKGMITLTAASNYNEFEFKGDFYIMRTLMNNLPNHSFPKPTSLHLDGIQLADPDFNISRSVDLLLGVDTYSAIIQSGIIHQGNSLPIAQQTRIGWILYGSVPTYQCNIVVNNIEDIKQFWTIEDIPDDTELSSEDQYCLQYYHETTRRQQDGKYVTRLPINPEKREDLGSSKNIAIAQFFNVEKQLKKNESTAKAYRSFMDEYIALGHMQESNNYGTNNDRKKTPECYLPHHCVRKADSTTTALRVVFNASAKTSNGLSLNNIMFSGPNLQQDLLSLIIKWRQYPISFVADLEKMFRQIYISSEDQNYQKIIWRDSPTKPLREYHLTTVSYGTKAAPFLAMMTLRRLANDERDKFPDAAKVVEQSFYMDDILHGSHNIQSAKKLQADLINLLKSGGFNLRKWSSNRLELLEGVSTAQDVKSTFEFAQQESSKTLGLHWHPQEDQFSFKPKIAIMSPSESIIITKRQLLSNISKVFDPLGWLNPVTSKLKLLFQKVIDHNIRWDDPISTDIKKEWEIMSQDLQNIKNIKIPRWINTCEKQMIELHGFCDASTKIYACTIYCRSFNQNKEPSLPIIVAAKSRLVPLKQKITLPRLELSAALLLSKLMQIVIQCLSSYEITIVAWSDSTAVLGWLQGDPTRWKSFVSHRVTKITKIIPAECWNYVKSQENPADCASRGITVTQLIQHQLWWNGPSWLLNYKQNKEKSPYHTDEEIKSVKQTNATTHNPYYDAIMHIINKCSSLTRATRIVAYMLRMTLLGKQRPRYLTTAELERARNIIIKHIQEIEFADEINCMKQKQNINSKSKILSLQPLLDKGGMLRVGGRLQNAHISWEMKHPLIIPHSSRLTELIIDQVHKSTLHGGARLTLAQSRRTFWIIGGNRAVKKQLRLCVTCRRQNPTKLTQLMGNLPESRVNMTRPFLHTGVDYTGFVNVKASKGRGIKTTKGYIAVFVCMVTKAAHLELVSDLTSESFLGALRRMSARRGAPQHIYSDNGTCFVKANKLLKKEFEEIQAILDEPFFKTISDMNITWHFNAPSFPSGGGLWEGCVKSTKLHLCRVLGDQRLTFEQFSTLLAQIESCLNARPLCALSEDIDDLDYLTPSHFLSGGPTLHILETERDERTRWCQTQKIFQDIWKRWHTEYLCQLQSRSKWRQSKPNIKVGELVVIHEANLPAGKWALGRVVDLHPGKDGHVRVVSVKTKNGILKRPIIKLSILPVSENESIQVSDTQEQNPSQQSGYESSNELPQTQRKQKANLSRNKLINIITMIVMLFTFIMTPVHCNYNYNISSFKNDQAVYFDKLSAVKLVRDEWKLIAYYDIGPYWQGLELLRLYNQHLEDSCIQIKDQSQCKIILLQLRHGYSELNYYNNILLGQRSDTTRVRRGLINAVGNIANSLFGVLDDRFAEQYQKDIELTRANENHLANLWKNQTSVIEAEYNLLKRVEDTVDQQHKIFNKHLQKLELVTNQMAQEIKDSERVNEFTLSSIIANSILVNLKNIQETLLDTITNVLHGKLNVHLLSPQQLLEELNTISGQLSKDLALPCENIHTDLSKTYQLLKIRTRMTNEFMIFEIKIPLVNRDTFELYKIIPIPHQRGSNRIQVIPISNQVAINIHKDLFIPLKDENLLKCMQFDTMTMICPLESPVYQLKSDQDFCVINQITNKCAIDTLTCDDIWSELNVLDTYLYFCCDKCIAKILCQDTISAEHFKGAGLLTIKQNCIIKGDSFTILSKQNPSSQTTIQADIVRFKMPSINNVVNLTVSDNIIESNSTEDNESKKLLNVIHNEIELLKTEGTLTNQVSNHDVHHYISIYVVGAISLILVGLYIRRCVRRRHIARLATPLIQISPPLPPPLRQLHGTRRNDQVYTAPRPRTRPERQEPVNQRAAQAPTLSSPSRPIEQDLHIGAVALNNTPAPSFLKKFTLLNN